MSDRAARRRRRAAPPDQPPVVIEGLTPRAREIAACARELLEAEGAAGLSMRNLAAGLGIRAPSLYKHFPSKDAIEALLISIGFSESRPGCSSRRSPTPGSR